MTPALEATLLTALILIGVSILVGWAFVCAEIENDFISATVFMSPIFGAIWVIFWATAQAPS